MAINPILIDNNWGSINGRVERERTSAASSLLQNLLTTSDSVIQTCIEVLDGLRKYVWENQGGYTATATPASDTFGSPYCQSDEEYWLSNEGLTSERQFHNKLMFLVNAIQFSYERNDIDGICDAVRRMLWVREQVMQEPFLSSYVTGLVLSLLSVGHACSDSYQVEDGYRIANQCAILLTAKRLYRAAAQLPARPDSECYYRLYELVAELKWKGGEELLGAFSTPDELISEYKVVEQRCLDYLRQTPSNDQTRNTRVKEALGWCRLQMAKMAIRWCPEYCAELIEDFNKIHGTRLTAEPGAFMTGQCTDAKNPWFWDLELFKWCTLGPATPDEAFMCHQWRLDAMRSARHERHGLEAYELATVRELQSLLHFNNRVEEASAA
jgi:hypothetical protein